MFDSLIAMIKSGAEAVMGFLSSCVGAVVGFFKGVITDFYDFFVSLLQMLWSAFQWLKIETMSYLYNLLKEMVTSLNIPFPSSLTQNIIDIYCMLNVWFPVDAAIDIGVILINTWLLVLSIKLVVKIKFLVGFLISRPLFK